MFKVYEERCPECLFGKDKIVSDSRRKDILETCRKKDSFFVCHKASLRGENVCCRGFYDAQGSSLIQLAKRLNVASFIPLPDAPISGQGNSSMDNPPNAFEVLTEVNERVQSGDLIYDREDQEWCACVPKQIGSYICQHGAVARAPLAPTVRRIRRTRAPQ